MSANTQQSKNSTKSSNIKIHKDVDTGNFFQVNKHTSEALRKLGRGLNDVWQSLLDNKSDWETYLKNMEIQFPYGIRQLQRKVAELVEYGLVKRKLIRRKHGHFGSEIEVFQTPQDHATKNLYEIIENKKPNLVLISTGDIQQKNLTTKCRPSADFTCHPTGDIQCRPLYNQQKENKTIYISSSSLDNNKYIASSVPKIEEDDEKFISNSNKEKTKNENIIKLNFADENNVDFVGDIDDIEAQNKTVPSKFSHTQYKSNVADPVHGTPVQGQSPQSPQIDQIFDIVISRVRPDMREHVSKTKISGYVGRYDVDRLSDIVIYAIENARSSVKGHIHACLENPGDISKQNYFISENLVDIKKEAETEHFVVLEGIDTHEKFDALISKIRGKIPEHSLKMWIDPMTFSEGKIIFPNKFTKITVMKNYSELLKADVGSSEIVPEVCKNTTEYVPEVCKNVTEYVHNQAETIQFMKETGLANRLRLGLNDVSNDAYKRKKKSIVAGKEKMHISNDRLIELQKQRDLLLNNTD